MGKGRHGGHGGGFGGGFGGHGGHHGGFGGGIGGHHGMGMGMGMGPMHHAGGFHHGLGMGMGMGRGMGLGVAHHRMFHGGPGYRGWWHPGGFGYWHGGWSGHGWFGRPCFGWFYPGWFYGWYPNLLFAGTPWFFGYPYYRPWYLPPRPSTTVVILQQSQPQQQQQSATSATLQSGNVNDGATAGGVVGSGTSASAPPTYAAATAPAAGAGVIDGNAPFGGEGDAEPVLPPAYVNSVKATIEAAFEYAAQHASVFWKFADSYPSGYEEIDTYFQRFAVQKEIDSAVFPEQALQQTLSVWDRIFCNANSALAQKRQLRTQRIKIAYREYLLAHCAREADFNSHFSNFQVAAHALYGCISKRYANAHSNEPVVFNFEDLQGFVAMLENRFGTTELAVDTQKSKKGQIPFFVVSQRNEGH